MVRVSIKGQSKDGNSHVLNRGLMYNTPTGKSNSNAQITQAVSLLEEYSHKQVEEIKGMSKNTLIRARKEL